MKGSWVTTFAVGGVILLLTLFLGLQYNWLKQAGEAEREQMQRRVDADTKAFADDFNREIQAAYFNFQVDPESFKKQDWSEFNERYEFWRSKTGYPELISEIVYFGKDNAQSLRFEPAVRSFVPADLDEPMKGLRAKIEGSQRFQSFYEDPLALIMPIHEPEPKLERIILRRTAVGEPLAGQPTPIKMPDRNGFLVIVLDRAVITGRMLPQLAALHFPEGNFHIDVTGKEGASIYAPAGTITDGGDAKAGLLSLAPDNLMFMANRGMWSKIEGEQRQDVVINERIESQTFTHSSTAPDGTKKGTFTFELKPDPAGHGVTKSRTSVIATAGADSDPWTLKAEHTSGSIAAFARGEFRKNFLIGLGVYLLLVGSIIAIVLSALRSKRFAQRQIDFVSSVSHEFRTPLAVIYSASENLADGVTKDVAQVSRYGNLIKGEGKKLSAMVEQILQFAGARSGKKKYSFSTVSVAAIVEAAIAECRPVLDEKGFEVETSVDAGLPLIKADAEALSTALQNLISNSAKYSNGSRWLRVEAANGNRRVKLTVEDHGLGIAADDLKQIFEPFYRAKDVVDAQIHGNGLGLALVKEIAEAHGGTVRVESEAGKGSRFTIELPV